MAVELSLLWRIARNSIAQRGVVPTLTQGPRYLATYLRHRQAWQDFDNADGFDKQYGTDTSSMVGPANSHVDSAQVRRVTRSRATRPRTFARIMQTLNIGHEDYVLVDFGSGKGRIVMLASELPFGRIIGVELSAKLHEVAQENIALSFDRRARKATTSSSSVGTRRPTRCPPTTRCSISSILLPFR
jgi:protein-L-isoaspartate O-methyltransferase